VTQYLDNNDDTGIPGGRDRTRYGVFLNVKMPLYQGGAINCAQSPPHEQALRSAEAPTTPPGSLYARGCWKRGIRFRVWPQRLSTLDFRERSISETRDLYRQQYLELGTRPLLDLLNAEQEIHQARMDRENTAADLRRLKIDCLYNTGGLRAAFHLDNSTLQGVEIRP
jgi:outer membrane protein, adhesin transport system